MVGLGGPVVVGLGGPALATPRDASRTTSRTNSHRAHTPEKSMARPDTREFVRTPEFEGGRQCHRHVQICKLLYAFYFFYIF